MIKNSPRKYVHKTDYHLKHNLSSGKFFQVNGGSCGYTMEKFDLGIHMFNY